MIELEYTTGMEKSPILPLSQMRLINLATYLAVFIVGVLGIGGLTNLWHRLAFAGLCLAFALVYAVAVRSEDFTRWMHGYFAVQTLLFMGLTAVRSSSGALTFLLFILAVHAATVFPGRSAAGWIALFYLLASLTDFLTTDPENAIGSALFNIAVFLLAGMIGHSTRQAELTSRFNQELVEVLQTVQRQLQELAVVEERNRLAREIHDGLGHYLTATAMQIQGAKALLENTGAASLAPAALGALGKAEILLQEALADVRRSVAALRTAPTENRPLPAAIGDLVAECQALAGLEAQFNLLGTPRLLNSQIELTLYRVAQEGLTNVRKHAQAGRVEVILAYDNDKVGLSICDDGRGMGETGHGYGLLGLRERIQLVDGQVNIDTAPDQGFRLEVEIPT
ncbi:MAG: sensor histidine kinase [Anaerolineales bacterium]|nr:sensor histidine kinase [Anaerolineales bacterium]